MNWQDQRERIRRFLRDPDGKIWSDNLLLDLFNDEQKSLQQKTGVLEDLTVLQVPPQFGLSYGVDWEYAYAHAGEGRAYQMLNYHHQSETVCTFEWEAQTQWGL